VAASNSDDPEDLRTFITGPPGRSGDGYAIPDAPPELTATRWLAYSESVNIAGLQIRKGFLYVGPTLVSPSRKPDPALINPQKAVASTGDYSEPHPDYRPNYSETTPTARRAYLQWLADGRSAPNADIGYVFLYFYGLERRIVLDILRDGIGASDFPDLYKELKRLYALFAAQSGSFRRYCAQLIELVEVAASKEQLYRSEVVAFQSAYGFPFLVRLALGQAVLDGVPIPASLALTWAEHDPRIVRRTAVTKCAAEFRKLFLSTYTAMHGDGIKILPNRTKLKLSYQPASAGFDGSGGVDMHFGDTPDIAALTGPVRILQEVVEACAANLDSFSRFLARNPGGRNTFEGILTLPVQLWTEPCRAGLDAIAAHVLTGPKTMLFGELVAFFASPNELGKDQQQALFRALEFRSLNSEPNILGTSRTFALDEPLVLFESGEAGAARVSEVYKVARLSVELGAAIAHADGSFLDSELTHLNHNIDRWAHLDGPERTRLKAYACLLKMTPPSLSSMKKKVDAFDATTRAAVAAFAASMVLADGAVSPHEVRLLEKFYQQLGLARVNVYRDIHSRETTGALPVASVIPTASLAPTPYLLDAVKIASLHAESRLIAERLAVIFAVEEDLVMPQTQLVSERLCTTSVMGLDEAHSAFARMLTSRASWQRAELANVADDLAIMLDGGLERINEASLDQHDVFFTEGDDPIEINPEIVEKLAQ
jgi:tellurite resistance protein